MSKVLPFSYLYAFFLIGRITIKRLIKIYILMPAEIRNHILMPSLATVIS
jgi:hypothetical protein